MKKENQKIVIGAIIFFLIIGLANWLYFTKIYSKKSEATPSPTPTPETAEQIEETVVSETITPTKVISPSPTLTPTPTSVLKFKMPTKILEKMPFPTSTPSPTPTIKFFMPTKTLYRSP